MIGNISGAGIEVMIPLLGWGEVNGDEFGCEGCSDSFKEEKVVVYGLLGIEISTKAFHRIITELNTLLMFKVKIIG